MDDKEKPFSLAWLMDDKEKPFSLAWLNSSYYETLFASTPWQNVSPIFLLVFF